MKIVETKRNKNSITIMEIYVILLDQIKVKLWIRYLLIYFMIFTLLLLLVKMIFLFLHPQVFLLPELLHHIHLTETGTASNNRGGGDADDDHDLEAATALKSFLRAARPLHALLIREHGAAAPIGTWRNFLASIFISHFLRYNILKITAFHLPTVTY